MRRSTALLCFSVVAVLGGCGSEGDGDGLSRQDVEARVATLAPETGQAQRAECVEREEERTFRCAITERDVTSYYTVFVSKDGERVQLREE